MQYDSTEPKIDLFSSQWLNKSDLSEQPIEGDEPFLSNLLIKDKLKIPKLFLSYLPFASILIS